MKHDMTKPCHQCPFLKTMERGFSKARLEEMASGPFPCHKTAEVVEDDDRGAEYHATDDSSQCAGALIYLEKRGMPSQNMRIMERLGLYDPTKLDMTAPVR